MNYYISDEEARNQIKGFVGIAPIFKSLTSLPDNMAGYISKSGREAGGEAPYFSKIQVELK